MPDTKMKVLKATSDSPSKDSNEEVSYKQNDGSFWKKIFLLPSEPVWYVMITVMNYFSVLYHIYTCVNGICATPMFRTYTDIFIVLDGLYLVDIALSIIEKFIPNMKRPEVNPSERPLFILILEILSLFPLEKFVDPKSDENLYCLLRINRALRAIKIIYLSFRIFNFIYTKLFVHLVYMCGAILFVVMIHFMIYCSCECLLDECIYHPCSKLGLMTIILTKLINTGNDFFDVGVSWELTATITSVFIFIFILSIGQATMTLYFINDSAHKVAYEERFYIIRLRHKMFKSATYLQQSSEDVFKLVWKNCHGYDDNTDFLNILTPALHNEILVDVSWPAFQHSKMFRNTDLPYLRYISKYMKQQFRLPGEFLIRKNEWKNKMIYVVSGIIQLLSEEDGESPIMSLTSGTCIGESSLILNYKSINSVRCQTFCEIHVLEKKDFMKTFQRFPKRYNALKDVIAQRINYAKTTSALASAVKMNLDQSERQTDIYTIFWIKNTLHRLMSRDAESTYRHEFQNIYLLNEVSIEKINKLLFTAIYLDLLVITERIQSDVDTIFVRTRFPCLLQPLSILVILWEVVVVFISTFLSFTIPVFAFVKAETSPWYLPVLYLGTLVYWFDIYVQLSTSLKTRQGVYTKFKQIAIARMQSMGFRLDMLSSIPLEVFTCMVLTDITPQNSARMHLNRTLKLWRVARLFKLWEQQFNVNIVIIRLLKFTCLMVYLSFVLFAALYNMQIYKEMKILFFTTTQIVTGVGMTSNHETDNIVFMIGFITCTICALLFNASIASGCVLNNLNLLRIQQVSYDLLTKLKGKKLYNKYNRRIIDYLNTQWEDNRCYHFQSKLFSVIYISKLIYNETVDGAVGDTVRSLEFFKLFNNDFTLDLCGKLLLMSFPPNEIIIRAGDISTEIIITHLGCCEMMAVGEKTKVINTPRDINLLEILLGVPNHNTCVTKTYCRVFKLDYSDFIQILTKYPTQLDKFNQVIKTCADLKERLLEISQTKKVDVVTSTESKQVNRCFYHFGYNLKIDSFEEYDYFIPFDRLFPFAWIRYLLARSTILPGGRFLHVWEISRSILAIMSALAYFTVPIATSNYHIILDILDTSATVDLYVRLHICYYDEDGLLIKHPLKTSMHYLKNGFLIDLISVIPLRHFGTINSPITYYLLNSNRLLQMHRYIHFMYYLQTNMIKPTSKYFILSYIPLILVLANLCGTCLVFQECTFNMEDTKMKQSTDLDGVICHNHSILRMANIQKPITKWRAHLYGIYIATTVLTTAGFRGYTITLNLAHIILNGLSIFGFYLIIVICGYIHTFYTFRQAYLLETQFMIRHLKKYLELINVSYELRTNIIKTYELKWKKMKGQSIYLLTKPFSAALRGDVLYDYFGHDLYVVSPFKTKTNSFYRNLLLHTNHSIILKGGYLSTINDIEKRTYILLKGIADILLPDGTKMATIYPGAIYGNLDIVKYVRIRISIVAMSHVEVLSIESSQFQSILNFHYKIKEEFCELRKVHLTHIPSTPNEIAFAHLFPSKTDEAYHTTYFLRAFDPNGRPMLIWKYFTLIYSCYIGILLDFYQIGVFEYSGMIVIIQITCDGLFLIYFILKDRLAYEDESGNIITDIKLIQLNNRKDTLRLWISILSLVPTDVVIFLMPFEVHTRNFYYSIFRLNRLLRLFFVFDYFTAKKQKLNVNVLLIRLQYVVFWCSLIIIILSCLFSLASCSFSINLYPRIVSCDIIQNMTSTERFRIFTTFLYVVADSFTLTSQNNYYPQSSLHIFLFISLLLVGHALHIACICEVFSILYDVNIKKSKFKSTVERITYFLNTENVSASLLQRVTAYVQLIWSHQEGEIYSRLLDDAPLYLQDALLNNAYNHILGNHPVFVQCHPDLLRQIIQKLRTRTYFVGDFIQFRGSIDDSMYFVLKGEVGVLYDEYRHKDDYIRKLTNGDSFGVLQGLYHRKPHQFSYRSLKRSYILRLELKDWEHVLSFFPASRESIFAAAKTYTN